MLALKRLEERIRRSFVMGLMNLRDEAAHLLVEALLKGEFPRGEAARISGLAERTASSQLSALVKAGLLVPDTTKGPVGPDRCAWGFRLRRRNGGSPT